MADLMCRHGRICGRCNLARCCIVCIFVNRYRGIVLCLQSYGSARRWPLCWRRHCCSPLAAAQPMPSHPRPRQAQRIPRLPRCPPRRLQRRRQHSRRASPKHSSCASSCRMNGRPGRYRIEGNPRFCIRIALLACEAAGVGKRSRLFHHRRLTTAAIIR